MLLTLCPNCPQQTWWTLILGWDSTFQAPCYKDAPKTFLNLKKKKNKDRNKEKTKKEKPSVEPLNLETTTITDLAINRNILWLYLAWLWSFHTDKICLQTEKH